MTAHWHTSLIRCYTIWILERCHDFFFIWMYVGNNSVLYTKVDRRHKQLNDSLTHKQHIWLHTSGTSAPVWFGKIMQIMQSLYANMSSCAKQWRHCFHFTLFVKLRVWWEREKERERERNISFHKTEPTVGWVNILWTHCGRSGQQVLWTIWGHEIIWIN